MIWEMYKILCLDRSTSFYPLAYRASSTTNNEAFPLSRYFIDNNQYKWEELHPSLHKMHESMYTESDIYPVSLQFPTLRSVLFIIGSLNYWTNDFRLPVLNSHSSDLALVPWLIACWASAILFWSNVFHFQHFLHCQQCTVTVHSDWDNLHWETGSHYICPNIFTILSMRLSCYITISPKKTYSLTVDANA